MTLADLTYIPTAALRDELRRRKPGRGQPPKLAPCSKCGKLLSTTDRRKACPAHGAPA
jgi:hypothetical protein